MCSHGVIAKTAAATEENSACVSFKAWDERTGRFFTDENGVPTNLLLDTDIPTDEMDIVESPHTREMTFMWEISTIFLILLLLIIPQTSTVWQDTERFAKITLHQGLHDVDGS